MVCKYHSRRGTTATQKFPCGGFKTQNFACLIFMTVGGDKILKHKVSTHVSWYKGCLFFFYSYEKCHSCNRSLYFTEGANTLDQCSSTILQILILSHTQAAYCILQTLCLEYRWGTRTCWFLYHCMGHLRLHTQWSSTFLRLHITVNCELPVTQLHNSTQNGWKNMQVSRFFFFFFFFFLHPIISAISVPFLSGK